MLNARIRLLPDQANKSGNHYPYNLGFYPLDNIISNAVAYYVVPELGPSAPTGAEKTGTINCLLNHGKWDGNEMYFVRDRGEGHKN